MAYIEVDIEKIKSNLQKVRNVCKREDVALNVVSKFCLSDPKIISALHDAGLDAIADSNMENFSRLPNALQNSLKKAVIKTRLTDITNIPLIEKNARPDTVFVSDEVLLQKIEELPHSLRPAVMLIIEAGDLRDGFYPDEIPSLVSRYANLNIAGISANLGCLSGKLPDAAIIQQLHDCAASLPLNKACVSIGGTVVWTLLSGGQISGLAGELRMGEGIFFGYDTSSGIVLDGFNRDAWTLLGEIIEIREKEITAIQNAGHTAIGQGAVPRKYGKRLCAVLDFGILGAAMETLVCLDSNMQIAGQTYDFTVVDITECEQTFKTGGFIPFRMMYAAASRAFLNPFIPLA